jgi:hypothetical protein
LDGDTSKKGSFIASTAKGQMVDLHRAQCHKAQDCPPAPSERRPGAGKLERPAATGGDTRMTVRAWTKLLVCILAMAWGCSPRARSWPRAEVPPAGDRPIHQWQETNAILERYLATADWRDRLRVADAWGEGEILASRIFRAFDIYVGLKPGFFVSYEAEGGLWRCLEEAKSELVRNPHLSLLYLRPIVDEVPPGEGDGVGDAVLDRTRPQYSEDYLCFCAGIAAVEEDGFAREVLRGLADHNKENVGESARGEVLDLDKFNIFSVGRRYRKGKAWEDLYWVSSHYLKRDLPRSKVEEHLGPGEVIDEHTVVYEGNESGGLSRFVTLKYSGDLLDTWGW